MKSLFIFIIRIYQAAISPFVGHCCRFFPTCSEYACQAMARHGAMKGSLLTLKRLSKCHPFHRGGSDPVP
ncbi:MAG: membrane protein insertion efficiency factor YidD [Chlamydiota bacterium]